MAKPVVDLRHLRVFVCLYELRSATRTAEALQTTQPGISIALARLRAYYGDPLFVRSGQTMQPTSRADLLHKPITDALRLLDESARLTEAFEPAASNWRVKLALPDGGRLGVLPKLTRLLEQEAPRMSVEVVSIDANTPDGLEAGRIDLAFGYMTPRRQGLYQQRLYRERFVCLLRSDHPEVGSTITREVLERLRSVQVLGLGNSTPLLAKAIERAGLLLNVAMVVPTVLGLADVVCMTDYVAMLPQRAALELARYYPVRTLPLPFDMDGYEISQHWHARLHHDAAHRWLRGRILETFGEGGGR